MDKYSDKTCTVQGCMAGSDTEDPVQQRAFAYSSKSFLHILDNDNLYVVFSKLKQKSFPEPLCLSKEALLRFAEFIERCSGSLYALGPDFYTSMDGLLAKVMPADVSSHIRCISRLDCVDLTHYRALFGYNKIYQSFKEAMATIYVEDFDARYIETLIRLLDNGDLVYKNILPIVTRLTTYAKKDLVDKNIGACCSALDAIVRCSPERFSNSVVVSMADYLVKLLHNPQNYLFLTEKDIKAILRAYSALCRCGAESPTAKATALGLLRMCLAKIVAYRNSSVHEEVLVVVHTCEALTPALEMYISSGGRKFDFIDVDALNFTFASTEPELKLPLSLEKLERLSAKVGDISEDGAGKQPSDLYKICSSAAAPRKTANAHNRRDRQLAQLQGQYIEAKYRFIDMLYPHLDCFDRIIFYNDLLQIRNPTRLFLNMPNIRKKLDWSDLIVFACNSTHKVYYIPVLFDACYLEQPEHRTYVPIFLKSLHSTPESLIFFTRVATDRQYYPVLMDLYFSDADCAPIMKRVRTMILKHILAMEQRAEEAPPKSEKFIDQIKRRLNKAQAEEEIDNAVDAMIADAVDDARAAIQDEHAAALFTVLLAKKTRTQSQLKLYRHMKARLASGELSESARRAYACLCAIILVRNEADFYMLEDRLASFYDFAIAFLSHKGAATKNDEYLQKIKIDTFDLVRDFTDCQIKEFRCLTGKGLNDVHASMYLTEYAMLGGIVGLGARR